MRLHVYIVVIYHLWWNEITWKSTCQGWTLRGNVARGEWEMKNRRWRRGGGGMYEWCVCNNVDMAWIDIFQVYCIVRYKFMRYKEMRERNDGFFIFLWLITYLHCHVSIVLNWWWKYDLSITRMNHDELCIICWF